MSNLIHLMNLVRKHRGSDGNLNFLEILPHSDLEGVLRTISAGETRGSSIQAIRLEKYEHGIAILTLSSDNFLCGVTMVMPIG